MLNGNLKEKISKTFHKSTSYENVFSENELLDFKKFLFANWRSSRTYQGGKILFDKFNDPAKNTIKEKLEKIFPSGIPGINLSWDKLRINGNLYITCSEYGLHTDSFRLEDILVKEFVALKNIIVPLDVCTNNINDITVNNVIVMENRYIAPNSNFQKNTKQEWFVQLQENILDYSNLEFFDSNNNLMNIDTNKMYISKNDLDLHFKYLEEKEILHGFKIENVFNFKPGNILIHDSTQAHITGDMKNHRTMVTNKLGLRLSISANIYDL